MNPNYGPNNPHHPQPYDPAIRTRELQEQNQQLTHELWQHEEQASVDEGLKLLGSMLDQPDLANDELRTLRTLAIAFIEGIANIPTEGYHAFDNTEALINEWYTEFGHLTPAAKEQVDRLAHLKQKQHPIKSLNRQQRRQSKKDIR